MTPKRNHLYFLLLLLPMLACSLTDGTLQESINPTEPAATSASADFAAATPANTTIDLANVPPLPISAEAGTACIGTSGYGLSCLDKSGWQTTTREAGLDSDAVYDMTSCPDGRLLLLHSSAVSAYDGKSWQVIEGGWGFGSPEAIACTAEGSIWVAHFEGVSVFDKGEWLTHSADQLATGEAVSDLVYDVAVAPNGTVWVVASNSVASYQNGTWTTYQEGQGFDGLFFFAAVVIDGNGRPWVAHSRGLVTLEDGTWLSFENPDLYTVESLAIDAQNHLWVGTLSQGVSLFDGRSWTPYTTQNAGLSSNHIRSIAADGQGRVWFGTNWGLNVFDGTTWHSYHMHTADLADNDIYSVMVAAGGPDLPVILNKKAGAMVGEVVDGSGRPIADANVEICVQELGFSYYGDTPCSDQPYFVRATTNSDGNFAFTELPAGRYIITFESGKNEWAQLTTDFGFSEMVLVEPGEELDLGELSVVEE